ncbi:cation:proton antiporter [Nanoarchaeota archaeon]
MDGIFWQIGVIFIIAATGAFIARLFKQPIIPAYIITGIIIGPIAGLITNTEIITTLSEIGIAFLLFIVGLELNFSRLKEVGLVASLGATSASIMIFALTFVVATFLSFRTIEAAYISLVVVFSSTMVVVKILSDKKELETLHGRIILGILLMQDVLAIAVLTSLTTIKEISAMLILLTALKAIAIIGIGWLGSKLIFPRIFGFAAKLPELLFMISVATCFLFATAFAYVGFSIAIGAFIAGVMLANLPYNIEIASRAKSLRDFFATLFFVSLGLELSLNGLSSLILPAIVFTLMVVFLKPFIFMVTCSFFRYPKKVLFKTANALGQVSEFSLIVIAQGLLLGHISQNIFTLTIILAVITISLTSYFLKFENKIYSRLPKFLDLFDFMKKSEEMKPSDEILEEKYEILLCGYDRIGYSVLKSLVKSKRRFLVIDYNPETIRMLTKRKIPCMYADVSDVEVMERLNLKDLKLVISTIPDMTDSIIIISKVRDVNKKAALFMTASHLDEALKLYEKGADYVILPHFLGGEHFSELLKTHTLDIKDLTARKLNHVASLKKRADLGHHHPVHLY